MSKMTMSGRFMITLVDAHTDEIVHREIVENTLTKINRDVRAKMLFGTAQADYSDLNTLRIERIAVGTGTTPATINDTKLEHEIFRKRLTTKNMLYDGTIETIVSINTDEANGLITEIGVFCGPEATDQADSGTLLSRVNVSLQKNDNLVLNITRADICELS